MRTLSLSSEVKIAEQVLFRDVGGEAILLNLKTGIYFGFDAVGARIWNLIEKFSRLDKVAKHLSDEYEVDEPTCHRDVLKLAAQLHEQGLVTLKD